MLEYLPPDEGKLRTRREHVTGHWLVREGRVSCYCNLRLSSYCARVPLLAIDRWGDWALGSDGRSYAAFAASGYQGKERPWSEYYE
jgi:hypothetical protein